jgi:Ca2+-binding RTX toxin-like protein
MTKIDGKERNGGNDLVYGGGGRDTIFGGAGKDTLYGGTDNDQICGGDDSDQLYGDAGDDTLNGGSGNDSLFGGDGIDTADYADAPSAVNVNLATGGATGGAGTDVLNSIENVMGSGFNDTLTGDAGNNALFGGDGADSMSGGAGADTLVGGAGNDTLHGGDGIDTADYSGNGAAVSVNLTTGVASGGAGSDRLSGIENVTGSAHADTLVGDGAANVLAGGDGNDSITAGGGADTVFGGAGDDWINGEGDLLINGGFESGQAVNTWSGTAIAGWQSASGQLEAWGNTHGGVRTADGGSFIELDHNRNSVDRIWQDVRTGSGETYNHTRHHMGHAQLLGHRHGRRGTAGNPRIGQSGRQLRGPARQCAPADLGQR